MKVIMKSLFGSHLYGLNTPSSDKDYKGVFIPSAQDILLQRVPKTISNNTNKSNTKNTVEDTDSELFSLQKFLEMASQGQTQALELLFTPDNMILEKTSEWDDIIKIRDQLLSKRVDAFIGYCRTQAAKYGVKGSRMATVEKTLDLLGSYDKARKLNEVWVDLKLFLAKLEHIDFIAPDKINRLHHDTLEVCGRKFQSTVTVNYAKEALQKIYDNYGHRAKAAKDSEGIDWKAISHAMRVCYQGLELLEKGKITLPLKEDARKELLEVKLGKIPYPQVQDKLESLMVLLESTKTVSKLPENIDSKLVDELVIKMYHSQVYDSVNNAG